MARFKKRPMEVEANRFLATEPVPLVVKWSEQSQCHYVTGDGSKQPAQMVIKHGDWIVQGQSGTYYGVPHDDFLRIYEPV